MMSIYIHLSAVPHTPRLLGDSEYITNLQVNLTLIQNLENKVRKMDLKIKCRLWNDIETRLSYPSSCRVGRSEFPEYNIKK